VHQRHRLLRGCPLQAGRRDNDCESPSHTPNASAFQTRPSSLGGAM
jgi:hypothetical protein